MKVRDLIRELQAVDGDREVFVGFPSYDDDGEPDGEYDVHPVLPELSSDLIENTLCVILFAEPEEEPEGDEEEEDEEDEETPPESA